MRRQLFADHAARHPGANARQNLYPPVSSLLATSPITKLAT